MAIKTLSLQPAEDSFNESLSIAYSQ